jgi:hypothetical protein
VTLADAIGGRRRRSPEYFELASFPVWKREQYFQPYFEGELDQTGTEREDPGEAYPFGGQGFPFGGEAYPFGGQGFPFGGQLFTVFEKEH